MHGDGTAQHAMQGLHRELGHTAQCYTISMTLSLLLHIANLSDSRVYGRAAPISTARHIQKCPATRLTSPKAHPEGLVEASGGVAGKDAHEDEEQQDGGHEAAAVGRRQEAQHRKDHGDHGHAEQLRSRPHKHCQQRGLARRPEHVSMHLHTRAHGA